MAGDQENRKILHRTVGIKTIHRQDNSPIRRNDTTTMALYGQFLLGPRLEAIPPLFGTPDFDLFRGYSVRRTLVRGTPTKVQMVRVRRILCSARKNP